MASSLRVRPAGEKVSPRMKRTLVACVAGVYVVLGTALCASAGPGPRAHAASWPGDPNVNLAVCVAPGSQYAPKMVSDGSGGAIVTWYDDDIHAQHVLAGGIVDPAWPAGGVAVCTAIGVSCPQL